MSDRSTRSPLLTTVLNLPVLYVAGFGPARRAGWSQD